MLIIALVLALIGLVALVFAVVTSNELVAWVCIGASVLGVVLLIVDALRERQRGDATAEGRDDEPVGDGAVSDACEYPEEVPHGGLHEGLEDTAAAKSVEHGTVPSEEPALPVEGRGEDPVR